MGSRETTSAVILSGGLDSSVALWLAGREGEVCEVLSFDYGQRHRKELEAAAQIAAIFGSTKHRILNLGDALAGENALTGGLAVPHGHYAAASMASTVVPYRNLVFLSIAAARAAASGCGRIVYGAHAGDHPIYPDCRPVFVNALQYALNWGDQAPITIHAPFLNMTKAEIVALGVALDVPLAVTWSCYEGGEVHCGKCGTCVERREAFQLAGVADPTTYKED